MLIDFSNTDTLQKQHWLHSAVVPRPIGLVSTVDREGVPNFDQLPASILNSCVLSANDLGQLAMASTIPAMDENFRHMGVEYTLEQPLTEKRSLELHEVAKKMHILGLEKEAWQVLLREHIVEPLMEGLFVIDRMD